MAAPNVNSTTSNITIRSGAVTVTNDSSALVLGNDAGSGHAYRVVAVRACNTSVTATTLSLVYLPSSSTGIGTSYCLTNGLILDGFSYIDLLDLQHPCHLEENTSLAIKNNFDLTSIDVFYSYEDIS